MALGDIFRSKKNILLRDWIQIIALLRMLNMLYHHAHINVQGENYYGDHLLLQRLYEEGASIEQIDQIMERLKGIIPDEPVSLSKVLDAMTVIREKSKLEDEEYRRNPWPLLIKLEQELQPLLIKAYKDVEVIVEFGALEAGISNLLQGLADKHQENIYLLQQRMMSAPQSL